MKKVLKWILYTVLTLIALVLIVAAFVKKEYTIEREVSINKPKSEVFDYIKYVKNQDNFSKWNKLDPDMKKTYEGTDGTVGFKYMWDSKKDDVGKGEQSIVKITEGQKVDLGLHFYKPMDSYADAYLATDSIGAAQTKAKWGFHGKMPYPMNILLLCGIDKMIGDDLQTGLNNLKTVLESK